MNALVVVGNNGMERPPATSGGLRNWGYSGSGDEIQIINQYEEAEERGRRANSSNGPRSRVTQPRQMKKRMLASPSSKDTGFTAPSLRPPTAAALTIFSGLSSSKNTRPPTTGDHYRLGSADS